MPKIGVVLSGCGVYDGTEVHEAAAALGSCGHAQLKLCLRSGAMPAGLSSDLSFFTISVGLE